MEKLSETAVQSLITANRYEKEARVMVNNVIDILVWQIQHSPVLDGPNNDYRQKSTSESRAETMQVLVKQVESMTPETEQKTIELVRASHAERLQQIEKVKAEKKPVSLNSVSTCDAKTQQAH